MFREPEYHIFLHGLNEPRGLWLQANGTLCVTEAGRVAEGQELGQGPTTYRGDTGALTCVDAEGHRRRIVEALPYVFYNSYGVSVGPTDVVELDGTLYLLVGEGKADLSRTVLRINGPNSTPEIVADILEFATENATPNFFDEVNIVANPYAMIPDPANERFLVTDGATGQVLSVWLDGNIEIFSPVEGHEVLTGIALGPDGLPYVASFSELPHATGTGQILRLHPDGTFGVAVDKLTTPIDLAFDNSGRLYVLEFVYASEEGHPYRGKTGRLLRFERGMDHWQEAQVLVDGLPYPTAMLIAPNDTLYISIHGAYSSPATGTVLRFDNLVRRERSQPSLAYREVSTQ